MARSAVHVAFYATAFRNHDLSAALEQIGAIAPRYGATGWAVYQSQDDLYRFLFVAEFDSKGDWDRYWYGEEFSEMRAACSSWYQVPLLYVWHDVVGAGSLTPAQ
jgi:hypothetical protein